MALDTVTANALKLQVYEAHFSTNNTIKNSLNDFIYTAGEDAIWDIKEFKKDFESTGAFRDLRETKANLAEAIKKGDQETIEELRLEVVRFEKECKTYKELYKKYYDKSSKKYGTDLKGMSFEHYVAFNEEDDKAFSKIEKEYYEQIKKLQIARQQKLEAQQQQKRQEITQFEKNLSKISPKPNWFGEMWQKITRSTTKISGQDKQGNQMVTASHSIDQNKLNPTIIFDKSLNYTGVEDGEYGSDIAGNHFSNGVQFNFTSKNDPAKKYIALIEKNNDSYRSGRLLFADNKGHKVTYLIYSDGELALEYGDATAISKEFIQKLKIDTGLGIKRNLVGNLNAI